MALPNFSLSEGGSLVITPSGGVAITIVDPRTISPTKISRAKIQWKSITRTSQRNATGSLEYGDSTVTAVYYKTEWDALNTALQANKILSAVITKANDINSTDGTRTVTLACQLSELTFPEFNSESKEMEYEFTLVIDSVTIA